MKLLLCSYCISMYYIALPYFFYYFFFESFFSLRLKYICSHIYIIDDFSCWKQFLFIIFCVCATREVACNFSNFEPQLKAMRGKKMSIHSNKHAANNVFCNLNNSHELAFFHFNCDFAPKRKRKKHTFSIESSNL